jgi:hypothetical protein
MKTVGGRALWISVLLIFLLGTIACDVLDVCGNKGYLKLTNRSCNTVQIILKDGIKYGTIYPGESDTFEISVGTHVVEIKNKKTGGDACCPSEITIVECGTESYSCSG